MSLNEEWVFIPDPISEEEFYRLTDNKYLFGCKIPEEGRANKLYITYEDKRVISLDFFNGSVCDVNQEEWFEYAVSNKDEFLYYIRHGSPLNERDSRLVKRTFERFLGRLE